MSADRKCEKHASLFLYCCCYLRIETIGVHLKKNSQLFINFVLGYIDEKVVTVTFKFFVQ